MRIDIHPDFLGESLARKKKTQRIRPAVEKSGGTAAPPSDPEYRKLLQSIYDAVAVTDYEGRIVDFNDRALDFFLREKEEFRGANIINLISGANVSLLEAIFRNLRDRRYTLIEAQCVRRDKSMFPSEIAVNKVALGDESRLCFFIRDISVRKRAQEALEKAVAELEEHDRSRSQFVSNVSHELRTPLTSMIYAVDNMLRGVAGELPERVKQYLEILKGDTRRLLNTVNDILDMRKLESGTLALARTRIPLARLAARSAESLRMQAEQKSLTLEISGSMPSTFVNCDPQKIERVVLNIVGNAVKFTPAGGTVKVRTEAVPGTENKVVMAIQDTGIGVPPEAIKKITERYFTVGEQSSGSGLGLAISREIVELHGGAMTVKSPPPGAEKGTGVYIALPAAEPPTVLVVDDEDAVRDLLCRQLKTQGYRTITAADGADALEKSEKQQPDILILDMVLPKINGRDVVLKLKGNKATQRIPVIAITGAHVGRGRAEILESFSIPLLAKPWNEMELFDIIESAFIGAASLKSRAEGINKGASVEEESK
ncbi:MAG: hybrid sensor histidine kinase/response regulator [Kiritimatiellia bacterium]